MPLLTNTKMRSGDHIVVSYPIKTARQGGGTFHFFVADHSIEICIVQLEYTVLDQCWVGSRKAGLQFKPCKGGVYSYSDQTYPKPRCMVEPKHYLGTILGKPPVDEYESRRYLKRVASYYHDVFYEMASKYWFTGLKAAGIL